MRSKGVPNTTIDDDATAFFGDFSPESIWPGFRMTTDIASIELKLMKSSRKVTFQNAPTLIDDKTSSFDSLSPIELFWPGFAKTEDDVPLLSDEERTRRHRAVKEHETQALQFFSKQPSVDPKLDEEDDDDEIEHYYTQHEGYEFQVMANEPDRSQMKPNFIYIFEASERRIAYKTFAPDQEHLPTELKRIVKDYIKTELLSEFKYPLTPVNLSPCLEDIIDFTKQRGHTPGYGEFSFDLVFTA